MLNFLLVPYQENKFLKFLSFMWNPLSWVMEAAAVMSIILANGGVSFVLTLIFNSSGDRDFLFNGVRLM